MSTIAYIRHTVNTLDGFYEKENDFNDENAPLIEQSEQKFTEAMLGSPLRAQLEEKYGKLMFVNAELSRKCFSPEIIPDLQEENKLSSEYQKLIASAQIGFNGEKLSLSQLGAYKENAKRDVRRAAYEAESGFYMAHGDELDRIFDSLVKCRTRIAKNSASTHSPSLHIAARRATAMTQGCFGFPLAHRARYSAGRLPPQGDAEKAHRHRRHENIRRPVRV